jgi:crotonobetainyl-CoA:carnitine CoA-transferase CaiB-like acyl-CoA transferase
VQEIARNATDASTAANEANESASDGRRVVAGTIEAINALGQLQATEAVEPLIDLGTIRLPGSPVTFSRSGAPQPQAPPTLGQHTDEVVADGE